MATGDQNDFVGRLRSLLPRGWFAEVGSTPFLYGILSGIASLHANAYAWLLYAKQQTRIASAIGEFLDIAAQDFLGGQVARNPGETDAAFRARIKLDILQPKATRAALLQAVQTITGAPGVLIEPANPSDCGGYASLAQPGVGGGCGYGISGAYGSLNLPFEAFLTVYRPPLVAPGIVGGYGSLAQPGSGGAVGGYATLSQPLVSEGTLEYVPLGTISGTSDTAIYAAIASVLPAAVIMWTQITNRPSVAGVEIDVNAYMDESAIS